MAYSIGKDKKKLLLVINLSPLALRKIILLDSSTILVIIPVTRSPHNNKWKQYMHGNESWDFVGSGQPASTSTSYSAILSQV